MLGLGNEIKFIKYYRWLRKFFFVVLCGWFYKRVGVLNGIVLIDDGGGLVIFGWEFCGGDCGY